jgi:23S rRNA (guanosine2251-2'-O)-methyltransferase
MKDEETFVFGVNPVREKLRASPRDVLEILIATSGEKPALRSIDAEARRIGLPVTYVNREFLSRLTRGEKHQGVLAKVEAHRHVPFAVLEQRISEPNAPGRVLILDGLTDPRNFGALLRTAEAVGIQHVIIPKDRSVKVTPTVVKASAGAIHYLTVYQATNLRRAMTVLKERGFWMVGLSAGAEADIYDIEYPERLGIVLGSEGKGARPIILKECDYLVSIPMLGKIASLNVAVAGGIFFYELLRQRQSIDKGGGTR